MRFGQIMIVNFPMPHALHKNNRTSRAVRSGFLVLYGKLWDEENKLGFIGQTE